MELLIILAVVSCFSFLLIHGGFNDLIERKIEVYHAQRSWREQKENEEHKEPHEKEPHNKEVALANEKKDRGSVSRSVDTQNKEDRERL